MCLHASQIPAEWCSRCTRDRKLNHTPPPTVAALDTDIILHDAATSARFDSHITPAGTSCLIFEHGQWGFRVNTKDGRRVAVTPARYAISRAGRRAAPHDVVKCTCGRTGDKHSNGVCVNPDHLITI